ncbi:MAG: hypothetical protein GY716_23145 [bacterium]|nr:hypothetical protein [bacterium]
MTIFVRRASILLLFILFANAALAQCTCAVCLGAGEIHYDAKKVEEHRTSIILPGDPNWMRGYSHYVHLDLPKTTSYVGGGYDVCYKCNGTGLTCDPASLRRRTDQVITTYRANGEGTLKMVETHSMGATLYGLADGNKRILIQPGELHIYPTKSGLVRFATRVDRGRTTSGLYAVGKGIIIPTGNWPGMVISEDGRLIIAYNVDTTYFFWDGERIREGHSVKEWQYKPNATETYFYDKVAFDFGGKTLYGLAKGWDKFIFPPIYEDIELLGNRPEEGIKVQFNGRSGTIVPPYGSFRFAPDANENSKKLGYQYHKVERNGKWALFLSETGEFLTEFKYDRVEYIYPTKRGVQPDLCISAHVGDQVDHFNENGEPVEKLETTTIAEIGPLMFVESGDQRFLFDHHGNRLETGELNAATTFNANRIEGNSAYAITLTTNGETTHGIFHNNDAKTYHSHGVYSEIESIGTSSR